MCDSDACRLDGVHDAKKKLVQCCLEGSAHEIADVLRADVPALHRTVVRTVSGTVHTSIVVLESMT